MEIKEDFFDEEEKTLPKNIENKLNSILKAMETKLYTPPEGWANKNQHISQCIDVSRDDNTQSNRVFAEVLRSITTILRRYGYFNTPISLIEEILKYEKAVLNHMKNRLIPDILSENGVSELTTSSGVNVKIRTAYNLKIMDKEKYHAFLSDNGYEYAIKKTFSFPRKEKTHLVEDFMLENKIIFEKKNSIHSQIEKKVIRELAEKKVFPTPDIAEISAFVYAGVKNI